MYNVSTTHYTGTGAVSVREIVIVLAFLVGCAGNVAALWILGRPASRPRNARHVLMLRCLASNDLLAQMGMLTLMYLQRTLFQSAYGQYYLCVLYVLVRAFGLGSGCVALVMAVERWLALTRPFFYQQYITYVVVKRSICILWIIAILITYAPLFGFGLFYHNGKCCRYREAVLIRDIAYAYLFLFFGMVLCVCIVCCNSLVLCRMAHIGEAQQTRKLVSRISRAIIASTNCKEKRAYITKDELAFAKLMAFLCIIFVICWLPQMISIPLAQFNASSRAYAVTGRLADMLMCVYFTLDPYVYVVHRYVNTCRQRRQRMCSHAPGVVRASSLIAATPSAPANAKPPSP